MKQLVVLAAVAALAGCAPRASSITPVSVSAADYAGWSCDRAREQIRTNTAELDRLTRAQNTASAVDSVAVAVTLIPVGSLFGGNRQGQIAQLKGETAALERHVAANCSA